MTPDDISLDTSPPLVGTLGRAELEHAAACLIRCHQVTGSWSPIDRATLVAVLRDSPGPLGPWLSNPFFVPRFLDLVRAGLAERNEQRTAMTLTDGALARIAAKHRRVAHLSLVGPAAERDP